MRARFKVLPVTIITLALGACQKSAPPAPPALEASSLPPIQVRSKAKLLYTYATPKGFETATDLDKIPEASRSCVRVVDLGQKVEQRKDHELVYVADLRELRKDGTYSYVVLSRSAFESLALNRARGVEPSSQPGAATASTAGKVILYATSWCPACRSARQYLTEKGIPFVEKDIEKDSSAAGELLQKARAQGISASGVPVLDVNGTLLQGFDPGRLEQLLGQKS